MAIVHGLVLHASTARTANGTGETIDLGARMAILTPRLEVTSVSGTTPSLTVAVYTSKTGNTWTLLDGGTFTAVTAAGLWELSLANAERYVRIAWTITGTSPSFTFEVTAQAEQLYVTVADMEAELSEDVLDQIYDDDESGEADEAPLMADIREAQSVVESYLRGLYALPIPDPIPTILKTITKDIAAAYAERRHPEYARADGKARYDISIERLKEIRSRNMRFDVPAEPTAVSNEAFVVITSPRRGWGEIGP